MAETFYCAYCLLPHSRGCACCCPEHTRKMRAWRGAVTAGHTRARRKVLAAVHKRERNRQLFRDAAMGRVALPTLFETLTGQATR